MTASHLKPSVKRAKSTWERGLSGQMVEKKGGHYDRGRGIEDIGDHVRENYANEEREYRRIWRIADGHPLNNRQQNAVYRNHVRTL